MAILLDERSRVLVQGATGVTGRRYIARMRKYGTAVVAGVTPGRRDRVEDVPVFPTVSRAVKETGANVSLVVVPAPGVLDAVWEAVASGIELISIYTENVPARDTVEMLAAARRYGVTVIGPNAAGVASPGIANISDLHDENLRRGSVGVVSKSGTLTYEVIEYLHAQGFGESTVVCLGGDPVVGTGYAEVLPLFAADPETTAVIMLGEIGGDAETRGAVEWRALGCSKPLIAYIAGRSAPPGKRLGHAGAIVAGRADGAAAKSEALREAGAHVAELLPDVRGLIVAEIPEAVQDARLTGSR